MSKDNPNYKRRRRGFEQATSGLGELIREAAGKRGIAELSLLTRWREICGPRLAQICRPERIRSDDRQYGVGGVLLLAVERACVAEVEMESAALVERVNTYYGYRAVSKIRLKHAMGALPPLPSRAPLAPPPRLEDLPHEPRAYVERCLQPVTDEQFRAALEVIGAGVMRRTAKKTQNSRAARWRAKMEGNNDA